MSKKLSEAEKAEKLRIKHKKKFDRWFTFLRGFYRVFMWFIFPYKKYGHTKPFNDRAYLFVGNHLSVMDVIPSALATRHGVHFMAKRELFEKGFMKWFTKKSQCIPINRDGSDVKALMTSMRYLKNGENVSVYPEGTRNKTGEMFLPFKSGAAAIAVKTKTPIVPMVQVRKIKMFHRFHVFYGEPFELSDYYDKKLTPEELQECENILLNKMTELYVGFRELLIEKKVIKESNK